MALFGIVAGILLDQNDKVVLAVRALALFIVVHLILFLMYALQFIPVEQIFVYAMIAGIIVVSAEAYMLTVPPLIMEETSSPASIPLCYFWISAFHTSSDPL